MIESLKEIQSSLELLTKLYLELSNNEKIDRQWFLLMFSMSIDSIEQETELINKMLHKKLND
jgi:hypothetical protein